MSHSTAKFPRETDTEFLQTLRKRIDEYFQSNNIDRFGNAEMVLKTIVMASLYLVPFGIMLSGVVTNPWVIFLLWVVMGVGMAGIGLSIMHDANHGAYSKNRQVNNYLSYFLNLVGGNRATWRIQHNILHHSYTNIEGMDEDIDPIGGAVRFSPHQKHYKFHKLQQYYAWFLYGFLTLSWITTKEFFQVFRFEKKGIASSQGSFKKLITELIIWKVVYYAYILVLPMILMPASPWLILLSFLSMHFVSGFIVSCIFQLAHVMPTSEYPLPNDLGVMENNWAIHQILTTANFSPSSKFFSWCIGGLNYQIEHHLFPNICHVHYKHISKIVKSTAKEFDLPYNSQPYFATAMVSHFKMLKELGNPANDTNSGLKFSM